MKIYTLGTSHGAAEAGRSCTATLLQTGEHLYLIDCGGSVEAAMTDLGFDFAKLRAVFITHMHEDHAGALTAVIKRVWGYTRGFGSAKFYLPEQAGIDGLRAWGDALHFRCLDRISYHLAVPGEFYRDDAITVRAILTRHFGNEIPSYAYEVECEGKRLLFTGDLRADLSDFPAPAFEAGYDCIVSEFTHFNLPEQMELLTKLRTKRLIFNHISPRNVNHMKTLSGGFPYPVIVADERGMYEV